MVKKNIFAECRFFVGKIKINRLGIFCYIWLGQKKTAMKTILITGATGNVGMEVIRFLFKNEFKGKVIAGVRDISKSGKALTGFEKLNFVKFDFEEPYTFKSALENVDSVFLLRPPHISDIDRFFNPLIKAMADTGIREIVFLSVQGAEKSRVIPHNKIEKLIVDAGIPYVFLRPSYFMQNLTTTLLPDILQKRKIVLPAGSARFNWIDVENIGETSAILLERFDEFSNQTIELTGNENLSFGEVTALINQTINDPLVFENVGPIRFFRMKKKEGRPEGMILVMILLHFLPRFQKEPVITHFYEKLTGKRTTSVEEFIRRERTKFEKS
jgi:uncharacterized protein YbjT (DUF2867 family)